MILEPFSLDRMVRAVERVRERALRATGALVQARTHLRVLLECRLIDGGWGQYYPPELVARLQLLVETPGG
jgi:hypothetical protein